VRGVIPLTQYTSGLAVAASGGPEASVPEPGMIGLGVLGMVLGRRRRKV